MLILEKGKIKEKGMPLSRITSAIFTSEGVKGYWGAGKPSAGYPISNFTGREFLQVEKSRGITSVALGSKIDNCQIQVEITFYPARPDDFLRDLQKETGLVLTLLFQTNDTALYRLHKPDEKITNPFNV